MTTTHQELKNDNVDVKLTHEPGCVVKFDVQLSPKASQNAYTEALKLVSKEVTIPGFRKGKAPDRMLIQQYGSYVDREWEDILLNSAFKEALIISELTPFSRESISNAKIKSKSKEGSQVSFECEIFPKVPDVNIETLTLDIVTPEPVEESKITEVIDDLRMNMATWENEPDRPLQEGDFAHLTIEKLSDPQEILCEDTPFEVAEGKMAKWVMDLIIGLTPGQTVEGTSKNEQEGDAPFIPTLCKITLISIKKPILPPIDEELAKKTGAKDVDDLNRKTIELLTKRAEKTALNKMKLQIRDQLMEQVFDLPKSLLKGHSNQTEAERHYRLMLIIQKLAKEYAIEVKPDEVYRQFLERQWRQRMGMEEASQYQNEEHEKTAIYTEMISNKVLKHIVDELSAKKA